ncbi:MAG: hypothetical protein RL386_902, partial [Bacteroidota bacterium]
PEVELVVGKLGRAESALDPAPINMYENVILYKSEYLTDEEGRRLRFRTDAEGGYVRDSLGGSGSRSGWAVLPAMAAAYPEPRRYLAGDRPGYAIAGSYFCP